jgi:hypothetical protein
MLLAWARGARVQVQVHTVRSRGRTDSDEPLKLRE